MKLDSNSVKFVSKISYVGPHQIASTGNKSQCFLVHFTDKALSEKMLKKVIHHNENKHKHL